MNGIFRIGISLYALLFMLPGVWASFFINPDSESDSIFSLINGKEYRMQVTRLDHPFLNSKIWEYGEIETITGVYSNVLINYDINQDALLLFFHYEARPVQIVLNPDYIKSFRINGRNFVNLDHHLNLCEFKHRSYYELLYRGKYELLVKWSKTLPEDEAVKQSRFKTEKTYNILSDNRISILRGRKSLLVLFPGKKKEIRKYLHANSLNIRQAGDDELIRMMHFCETL